VLPGGVGERLLLDPRHLLGGVAAEPDAVALPRPGRVRRARAPGGGAGRRHRGLVRDRGRGHHPAREREGGRDRARRALAARVAAGGSSPAEAAIRSSPQRRAGLPR
jgi:hypothetical protein